MTISPLQYRHMNYAVQRQPSSSSSSSLGIISEVESLGNYEINENGEAVDEWKCVSNFTSIYNIAQAVETSTP